MANWQGEQVGRRGRVVRAGLAAALCAAIAAGAALAPAPHAAQAEGEAGLSAFDLVPEDATSASGGKITVLDDGTEIQRTPDDENSAVYSNPRNAPSYNVKYLDADERGCGACHADLGEVLAGMEYEHIDMRADRFTQLSVDTCRACHETNYYMTTLYTFGELIHGIHRDVADADCMTCHAVTDTWDGDLFSGTDYHAGDFALWDDVKYDLLRGISTSDEIEGEFAYDQDYMSDSLFYASWLSWGSDYERYANEDEQLPRDEQMLRDWEIAIVGPDGNRVSYTMGELIDDIPSVEDVRTMQCTINTNNGGLVGNVKVKGIPLSQVIERAGYDPDDVKSLLILDPDQAAAQWSGYPFAYVDSEENPDLLVYEINDELLTWGNGFPVVNWASGTSYAGADVKQVTDIYLRTEEKEANSSSRPLVSVYDLHEGQVVHLGDTLHLEGVADSFAASITAIEFSLDGEYWTTCPTDGTHAGNWVHWTFDWTPEEEGAFVLHIRATDSTGSQSENELRYLINVKADEA